ncbi:MAG: FAD-binding oxidoreductase [Calditrichaeota bacterium]|nr:MAG: FAD-binding oxidoreductase [Calditrichota bacterium]
MNKTSLPDFFHALTKATSGDILNDQLSLILYSTDASIYSIPPIGVFIPKSVEDIQAAVTVAAEYKIPILPRGAGTSLAGQAVNEALIIDTTRHLDHIVEINKEEKYVRVQPGVVLEELNSELRPLALKFGPDPASANRATMGGVIGNNATGSHSILYGMSADHIQETECILSDGSQAHFSALSSQQLDFKKNINSMEGEIYRQISQIISDGETIIRENTPKHWRRAGAYNLDRFVEGPAFLHRRQADFNLSNLLCGSEGSLAVMTEIKCGLVPVPAYTALAVLHFFDHMAALQATEVVMQTNPDAVELFDGWCLALAKTVPHYAQMLKTFVSGNPNCLLIAEVSGSSPAELKSKLAHLSRHLQKNHVKCAFSEAISTEQQQNVWAVRKAGLGLLASRRGEYKPVPFIEDAAVPVRELPDYVRAIEKFCQQSQVDLAYYAHASAGCLHIRPFLNLKEKKDIGFMKELAAFSAELALKTGGVISSEHGAGRSRSWLNKVVFGKELYHLFGRVKSAFDPENLMNPGVITTPQKIDENVRYGENYRTEKVATNYSFQNEQGFAAAVEMCTGAAVCNKKNTGSMCPSYMVTRDEKHSTRGRANVLRAALSTEISSLNLTDKEVYDTLDLCVECKACKSECPSKVDMAKLKFEFLTQYQAKHGVPLRSRLFAEISLISHFCSGAAARLVNPILNSVIVRGLMSKFLGITSQRKLMQFTTRPFVAWFEKNRKSMPGTTKNKVALFHDTFNSCSQPDVLIAATKLLVIAGFEVILTNHGCCGRSMISKGLFKRAKKMAQNTVDRLHEFSEQDIPIVGVEPSCLLTLRDEYKDILPDDPRVEKIASNAYLIEEFILQFADLDQLRNKMKNSKVEILLHGHCHQKAIAGTSATHAFFDLIPGSHCTEIDSACCGLAGSFGYEKEHYEISMAMGERRLFPAVRAAEKNVSIAVPGFSCRQQIKHGTDRIPKHPVEIFIEFLENESA